jgi:hypothetical protein
MAKKNTRLTIKGFLDIDEKTITEHDKDLGDVVHRLDDLFLNFNGLDDVTLTLTHDEVIEGHQE